MPIRHILRRTRRSFLFFFFPSLSLSLSILQVSPSPALPTYASTSGTPVLGYRACRLALPLGRTLSANPAACLPSAASHGLIYFLCFPPSFINFCHIKNGSKGTNRTSTSPLIAGTFALRLRTLIMVLLFWKSSVGGISLVGFWVASFALVLHRDSKKKKTKKDTPATTD